MSFLVHCGGCDDRGDGGGVSGGDGGGVGDGDGGDGGGNVVNCPTR